MFFGISASLLLMFVINDLLALEGSNRFIFYVVAYLVKYGNVDKHIFGEGKAMERIRSWFVLSPSLRRLERICKSRGGFPSCFL